MPQRIQRRRLKGWKKPDGAIYVGRGSRWGNNFVPSNYDYQGRLWAMVMHAEALAQDPQTRAQIVEELQGKNLMCWCPLDQPCHADTLLAIANDQLTNTNTQKP